MPTYQTYRVAKLVDADPAGDGYIVTAPSEADARALCAKVVPGASDATNPTAYYCIPDHSMSPPPGVVISTGGKTYSEPTNAHRT